MTFDLKHITKYFRLPKKGEYRTISAKARHDWKLIVLVSMVLVIGMISYNALLFRKVTAAESNISASAPPASREEVNQKTLQDTIDYYKAKAEKLDTLKTTRPNTFDPSL